MGTEVIEQAIRTGEWFVVLATIAGPVLAVQAQKFIERTQKKREMKDGIFQRLMATRSNRLSQEHVEALNMISIAFYGSRRFGIRFQSKMEKAVCRLWRDYFDILSVENKNFTDDQNERLVDGRTEKFMTLLETIAIAQNFDFEPLELRKQMYSPVFHGQREAEANAIRVGMARILSGDASLRMEVTNLPRNNPPGDVVA